MHAPAVGWAGFGKAPIRPIVPDRTVSRKRVAGRRGMRAGTGEGRGIVVVRAEPSSLGGVPVANTPARWALCFLVLPVIWIAGSLATGVHAVRMIPAALLVSLASSLTAWRSGRGVHAVVGYFVGAAALMGVAFAVAVVAMFTISCDGTGGDC